MGQPTQGEVVKWGAMEEGEQTEMKKKNVKTNNNKGRRAPVKKG